MSHVKTHLRKWMKANRVSMAGLERCAGMGKDSLGQIMRGYRRMSPKTFRKLDPIVAFPQEARDEVAANFKTLVKIRKSGGRWKPFNRKHRVKQLIKEKPIYARAWA